MVAMRHVLAFLSIMASCLAVRTLAGDSIVARQQFKESPTYPFIFKAEGYLAVKGPLPMRFRAAGPQCEQRRPPAPPVLAKSEATGQSSASEAKEPGGPPSAHDGTVSTAVETTTKRDQPDFTKVPDEVLDFFKNTEGRPVRRAYLFDPIFQPVTPNDLPKSKATSQQK